MYNYYGDFMHRLIECKLVIESFIEGKKDSSIIKGKGFIKEDDMNKVIYFSNNENKFKYEYNDDNVLIHFNDSYYDFKLKTRGEGVIKNGDYVLKITTYASKIEINNNSIIVNYELYQNNFKLGEYKTSLFFA